MPSVFAPEDSLRGASGADYPLHGVVLLNADGRELVTGGYVTKRDDRGWATAGKGQWWAGISWSSDDEHGPYRIRASARMAVQILTPGFGNR